MSKAGGYPLRQSSLEKALHLLTNIVREKCSSLFGHFGSHEEKTVLKHLHAKCFKIHEHFFFFIVAYGFKNIKMCLHGTTTIIIKTLLIMTLHIAIMTLHIAIMNATLLIMDFTYN